MTKTLDDFVKKGHVRYMPPEIQAELKDRVPNCQGGPAEAMFWVLHGLTDYPTCKGCGVKLSSAHWEPFLKPEHRTNPNIKQGYRPFCGKSCAFKYGTKQENFKKTSIKRYGVEHPMQNPAVLMKVKATNIEKYGESHPMRWTGDKFLGIMRERYGTTVVRHVPEVHASIIETIAQKTTNELPKRIQQLEKEFDVRCLTNIKALGKIYRVYDITFIWRHSCGRTYESVISEKGIRRCPSCSASSTSTGEREVAEFIEALGIKIENRARGVIPPRELDIWIPEKKLAIEFDGTYWHSAKFEDKKKCLEKLELCEQNGIHLITLQEHLWVNRRELVKNRLRSILGKNEKLSARECSVAPISNAEAKQFLLANHLQGYARSSIQLGLFHENKLVSVATFARPRWAKTYDWELIRMASLAGVTVQGGASKLMKSFRRENPGTIISYADRCWSTGNVYRQLGFQFSHNTSPSYWWVHHFLGSYARYQTQKKKLPTLLGRLGKDFYPELTEEDNMRMAGFLPLYDRGNSVWILN